METPLIFVGIDVSKKRLDVALRPSGEVFTVANDPTGLHQLVTRLALLSPDLIILEASGGYELTAAATLRQAGLPAERVNPRQVRDFARATGLLAKTDRLDALVIARYAEAVRPALRPFPEAEQLELTALMGRHRQLTEMVVMEKNRLDTTFSVRVRQSLLDHLRSLKQQLQELEEELDDFLKQHPLFADKAKLLRTTPGVGPGTCFCLLAWLPELGTLTRKQIAALAGLAPFNRDSGQWRGKRAVWGGRARVRTFLYMATVSASRCNPVIRTFYRRLLQAGKPAKVALTACMRKLLTILNAMLKNHQPWCCQE
jgi:transposase